MEPRPWYWDGTQTLGWNPRPLDGTPDPARWTGTPDLGSGPPDPRLGHLGGLQQQLLDDEVLLARQTHRVLAALGHSEALAADWLLLLGPERTGLGLPLLQGRKSQLLIGPPDPLQRWTGQGLGEYTVQH